MNLDHKWRECIDTLIYRFIARRAEYSIFLERILAVNFFMLNFSCDSRRQRRRQPQRRRFQNRLGPRPFPRPPLSLCRIFENGGILEQRVSHRFLQRLSRMQKIRSLLNRIIEGSCNPITLCDTGILGPHPGHMRNYLRCFKRIDIDRSLAPLENLLEHFFVGNLNSAPFAQFQSAVRSRSQVHPCRKDRRRSHDRNRSSFG